MRAGESAAPRLYWPQLDGLRFFAALLVFIHHSPSLPGVPPFVRTWGWVGVDLFLVLSAFLLTRLLVAEFERGGRVDVRNYFLRRALRIWPLHWGFVTAMLVFVAFRAPDDLPAAFRDWLTHVAFFNNFDAAFGGQFSKALPYTAHLWTISLEEQFYLVVPFSVPLLARLRGAKVGGWLALSVALAALMAARAACVEARMFHPFIWALPLRMDGLVLGTALGAASGFGWRGLALVRSPGRGNLLFLLGVGLLWAATGLPPIEEVGWGQVVAYPVVDVACLLLVVGCLHGRVPSAALALPPFRYLGKISFGIYVYHLVVLHPLRGWLLAAGVHGPWTIFATTLVATGLVAAVSYELFEKPFLRWKARLASVPSRPP